MTPKPPGYYAGTAMGAQMDKAWQDGYRAALANQPEPTRGAEDGWKVHNHDTETGRGIACREYHLNGRLVGSCLIVAATSTPEGTEGP